MGNKGRKYCKLLIPKDLDVVFKKVAFDEEVYKDPKFTEPVKVKKDTIELELEIPVEVEMLTIKKVSAFSPIVALGLNNQIWPSKNKTGLRFIFDNRNISMLDADGNFRTEKYHGLCRDLSWKKWVLALYESKAGSEGVLYWKP